MMSIFSSSTSTATPIAPKIFFTRSTSSFVVRLPRENPVAAWQIAEGVLVSARMNRASPVFSMLAIRTPPASEITSLFPSSSFNPVRTDTTIGGFTPMKMTSAFCATSTFSPVTATLVSFFNALRVCSFGSLAMIFSGAQNFARINPRMTEPANFPAPMKPSW